MLSGVKVVGWVELCLGWGVLMVHSKITFSIARNVIMIGLLSKRGALRQRPSFLFV